MATATQLSYQTQERMIRCPRCKGALAWTPTTVVCNPCHKTYQIKTGERPIFSMFIDEHANEVGRDAGQVWDLKSFEEAYQTIGYHEEGAEFEKQLGWPPEVSRFHYERVKQRLMNWVKPGPGHSILDVGCGAGYFLCLIRDIYRKQGHEPHLSGIDISTAQLSYMARRMVKEGVQDANIVHANSEYLPFADRSFDLVTCSEVIEHVRNPERALSEMQRVLKPTGQVLVSTPSMTAEKGWNILLGPVAAMVKLLKGYQSERVKVDAGYDVPWYPSDLKRAFESAQLEIESFEQNGIIPHSHYFKFLPTSLVKPVVGACEFADTYLYPVLKPLGWHLLVRARRKG